MTLEEAQELLETHEDDYASDGGRNYIRRGLEILEKYDDNVSCDAQHDTLYASEFNEAMTEEDILALLRLGWHLDEEGECWAY